MLFHDVIGCYKRNTSSGRWIPSVRRAVGEVECLDETGSDDLFDDVEQLVAASRAIGKDAERDFTARRIVVATGTPDVPERLPEHVTDVNAWIRRPCAEMDGVVDDAEDDDGFDAL